MNTTAQDIKGASNKHANLNSCLSFYPFYGPFWRRVTLSEHLLYTRYFTKRTCLTSKTVLWGRGDPMGSEADITWGWWFIERFFFNVTLRD